jgi:poly(3-hydroxybutyrate) depolymerase
VVRVTTTRPIHRTRIVVTDRTRPTVSHGHVLAHHRTLPTLVWRPEAPGRYPLIVFCHGYDSSPLPYRHLLKHWAAAGFVVAAPYFPLTRSAAGRWLDESDVDNQPGDVSAVITAVEHRFVQAVDPQHVVVAGHSDGGSTAFGVGFADRLRDPRVSAVMVFSGAKRHPMGRFSRRRLPTLLVQSDADESNSLRDAAQVWAVPRRPKVYLHLHGAAHLPPFASPCPWRPIVEAVTTDFLRAWTTTIPGVRRAERRALDHAGTRNGLSWVTDAR